VKEKAIEKLVEFLKDTDITREEIEKTKLYLRLIHTRKTWKNNLLISGIVLTRCFLIERVSISN
jgi:hypothetical protein